MELLDILKYFVSIATVLVGIVALFWPDKIKGFTGLSYSGQRGVTEIRVVLGAFFIGLGAAALYLNDAAAFSMLGITYLIAGIVRIISMFIDKSVEPSNIISVLFELFAGVVLVL
jgi:uncharacterized membrane protein HdeD (DUF308 family)